MRAIARHIGYSATAIYQHFESKEHLLHEVCVRDFRGLSTAFLLHVASVSDPLERLRRMGRSYLDFAVRHPRQYAFLFMTLRPPHSLGAGAVDSAPVDDAYLLLFTTIGEAAAQDRFRPDLGDPERLARLFWGSLHGLAALHVARPHRDWLDGGDIVSLSETAIDVMLRGTVR
ncbi:MAG: TetR family transcriptional regulator [Gemmatimonadota bacterium]